MTPVLQAGAEICVVDPLLPAEAKMVTPASVKFLTALASAGSSLSHSLAEP